MAKERAHIKASNGLWVKSISYTKGTFELTADKSKAKGYTKQEMIQGDIDTCTLFSAQRGMGLVFYYD